MGEGKTTESRKRLYRTEYEWDSTESVSTAVVEAISTAKEIDPVTNQFCLYDYLDPGALDALVASRDTEFTLTFTIDTHRVTVESTGTVTVSDLATNSGHDVEKPSEEAISPKTDR